MNKDKNKMITENMFAEYIEHTNRMGIQANSEKVNAFLNSLYEKTVLVKCSKDEEELSSNIQRLIQFIKENKGLIDKDDSLKEILSFHFQNLKDLFYGCFFLTDVELAENDESRINYSRNSNPDVIVDHIAQKIRYQLFRSKINRENGSIVDNNYDSKEDSLINKGTIVTQRVLRLAERMGLVARGYKTEKIIDGKDLLEPHSFSIIEIDDKKYILDCTFKQFFSLMFYKDLRNLLADEQVESSVGEKILSDSRCAIIAKQILKNGWIEATGENIKMYLDAFVKEGHEYSEEEYIAKLNSENEMEKDAIFFKGKKSKKFVDMIETGNSFIIESEPMIDANFRDIEEEFDLSWNNEKIINTLVQRERLRLSRMVGKEYQLYNLKTDSLRRECRHSCRMIKEECQERGIDCQNIYTRNYSYGSGSDSIELDILLGHNFNIITLNGILYLVDCTYRQYFTSLLNNRSNFHHEPGMYMIEDKKRREVAERILKYGWIEATPENIKAYMDGFVMASKRDSSETGITGEQYLEMFMEKEPQIDLSEILRFIMSNGLGKDLGLDSRRKYEL